ARLLAAFRGEGDLRARLGHLVGAYLDHLAADRDLPRLIQRALLDRDPHLRRIAGEHLRPLLAALRPLVSGDPSAGVDEIITSIFGALIAPFLYEPLLSDLFGRDVLAADALARRRDHVLALLDLALARLGDAERGD
ncbi:MAG: hypothetical protein KC420_12510, partial [Myxococcales bacterium]|nr:hypothetical protein [Myxococcales bacterium]